MEMAKNHPAPQSTPKRAAPQALEASEKDRVIKRLLADLAEYYETFGKGCPLKAMSAKYAKALRGDFYDVLTALEDSGKITIVMLEETAAKVIYPGKKKK